MIKRILVALPGIGGGDPVSRCVADLATRQGCSVTGVAAINANAWKSGLPGLMSAGFGARLLETRPWQASADAVDQIETHFEAFCRSAKIPVEIHRSECDPIQALSRLASFHDIVVAPPVSVLGRDADASLERALQASGSGAPLLRPDRTFDGVTRMLLLLTDDPASLRALRAFVQLAPWPEASLFVAGCGWKSSSPALVAAADHCAAHGFRAEIVPVPEGHPDVISWATERSIDLVVAGWSWLQSAAHTGGPSPTRAPSLFLAP